MVNIKKFYEISGLKFANYIMICTYENEHLLMLF